MHFSAENSILQTLKGWGIVALLKNVGLVNFLFDKPFAKRYGFELDSFLSACGGKLEKLVKMSCRGQLINLGEAAWHTGFPPSRSHLLALFMRIYSELAEAACGELAEPIKIANNTTETRPNTPP